MFFWSVFFRIRTEYGVSLRTMRENTDQKNSKYGHFLRSVACKVIHGQTKRSRTFMVIFQDFQDLLSYFEKSFLFDFTYSKLDFSNFSREQCKQNKLIIFFVTVCEIQ